MNTRGLIARTAAGALGGVLLLGAAGAAIADEVGDQDVAVNVEIEALEPVGALTMTVGQSSTSLTEVDSGDPELRQFNGVLPTVTVSDDREEVPVGLYWYVSGQSSALTTTGGAPAIAPGQLGWAPKLLTPGNGEVAEGDRIETVLDEASSGAGTPSANNVGLVGEELLALASESADAHAVGEWKASADLFLKTPKNVAPGSYSGTLTLTLWEGEY